MGVLKWLRRERITLTSRRSVSPSRSESETVAGTIRTEEYKRDLAEFQARRSSSQHQDTPRKCRHSLSGCTDCATDPDRTFNYEKKSATKYKKKRARSASEDVPNIQFLFQNQVFMPGNLIAQATYSEPYKPRRRKSDHRPLDQKHIDFKEDSPPLFYKNNSLPFDVRNFVSSPSEEEVDGVDSKVLQSRSASTSASSKADTSGERLLEVMSELRSFDQWADEQLRNHSVDSVKLDDSKSDTSYGLPIVSSSDVDVTSELGRGQGGAWREGRWGAIPVHVRRLPGISVRRASKDMQLNILRKCRHPNIILLMGIYPDVRRDVTLICERCVGPLYDIVHLQGRVLTAQTSVQYACDVANALVFLRMRGYIHTAPNSHGIVVTSRDTAKLADVAPCVAVSRPEERRAVVDPVTRYENIGEARGTLSPDCEPLLSARSSEEEAGGASCDVTPSPHYRWLAPEMFQEGRVRVCDRTTVYSLAMVLWECCNATVPWESLTYEKLSEVYRVWGAGPRLASDGVYPGALLGLLQGGLKVPRAERPPLNEFADQLGRVKQTLDKMEYIVIPARVKKNPSDFSSVWASPPRASPAPLPDSDNEETNAIYETLEKPTYATVEKCYLSEDETDRLPSIYERLRDKDYSSACSTPISKIRTRIKDMGTPIGLHRSDSTEYCSIMSPDSRNLKSYDGNNNSTSAKFSKSFTPQSYKPLHIKVPEFNLDSFRALPKDNSGTKSSYSFDIKNYSLPNTPIARSNKLRKNAWLSGDLVSDRSGKEAVNTQEEEDINQVQSASGTPAISTCSSIEKDHDVNSNKTCDDERSPQSVENRDHFVTFRTSHHESPPSSGRERTHSWSSKTVERSPRRSDEALAGVTVKPLVAMHERAIYEAGRRPCRAMSLPEDHSVRGTGAAVKPASHIVAPRPLPALAPRLPPPPPLPSALPSVTLPHDNGGLSEQFCWARDNIARCMTFNRSPEQNSLRPNREIKKSSIQTQPTPPPQKVDQTTDTSSIEEFIRDIIRKEVHALLQAEIDDHPDKTSRSDDLLARGVSHVLDALNRPDEHKTKISRLKINGNNKPLLQITFSKNGDNNLHILDNCVNVTFCDKGDDKVNLSLDGRDKMSVSMEGRDRLNVSLDAPPSPAEGPHSLKRCQTFNALQEARSTEDLYIDDELSSQLLESGGRRLGLQGELHELLCERRDDCCLLRIKQENGYDTVYFRCDNSDTESRDAPDGHDPSTDTVVYKRSISVIEERIERVVKDKRPTPVKKNPTRPKSEVFLHKLNTETKVLSNSSPSLSTIKDEGVELNIENVMSYQDSSSDECLKCQVDDDFEILEREIEEEVANDTSLSKCLNKISEEELSVIDEEVEAGSSDEVFVTSEHMLASAEW